jgi:hypothetical protein
MLPKFLLFYILILAPRGARINYLIALAGQYKDIFNYYYNKIAAGDIKFSNRTIINSNLQIVKNFEFKYVADKLLKWCDKKEIIIYLSAYIKTNASHLLLKKICKHSIKELLHLKLHESYLTDSILQLIKKYSTREFKDAIYPHILSKEKYFKYASQTKNISLMKELIHHSKIYYCLEYPEIFNTNIAEYVKDKPELEEKTFKYAMKTKNRKIIEELNYPIFFKTAFETNDEEFIKYCLSREKPYKSVIINNICICYKYNSIVVLIEDYEDADYKKIISSLCTCPIIPINFIKFIYKKIKFHDYTTDYMKLACQSGNKELLNFFIKKGFTNWTDGLIGALTYNNSYIIKLMIQRGASLQTIEVRRINTKNQKILRYIINQNILRFFPLLTNIYDRKFIIDIFDILPDSKKEILIRYTALKGRFNIFKILTKRYDFKENLIDEAIESGHIFLINFFSAKI